MSTLAGPGREARFGFPGRAGGSATTSAGRHGWRLALALGTLCVFAILAAAPAGAVAFTALADDPDPVAPGGELTFSITLRGSVGGDSGVVLQHAFPPGSVLSFVTDTWDNGGGSLCTVEESPDRVRCALGSFSSLQQRSGSITFAVDAEADAGSISTLFRACTGDPADCASTGVTDSESTLVERADLAVAFTSEPAVAVPGEDLVYVVEVENLGDTDARAAVLTVAPPEGLPQASFTGACTETTGPTCTLGDLAPGSANAESVTVTFAVPADYHVAPGNPTGITAAAEVATDSFDEDATNDSATAAEAEVTPRSQLTVELAAPSPNEAVPGQDLSYTVTVTNSGPSVAAAVSLDPAAPTGLPAPTFGGDCNGATCSLGDLAVASAVVTVTFAVPGDYHFAGLGNPDPIAYTASVAEPRPPDTDPPSSVYEDTVDDTAVAPEADLSVASYTVDQDPAVPGTAITYVVTVANDGPSSVDALTLTGAVPAGILSPVFLPGEGGYNTSGDWLGLDLANGETVTLTIRGWVDPALDPDSGDGVTPAQLSSTVTVAPRAGVEDPDSADLEATVSPELQGETDLGVLKDDGVDILVPPATTTYGIQLTNSGPSDVLSARLTDAFDMTRLQAPVTWTCSPGALVRLLDSYVDGTPPVDGLDGASSVVVSADGASVYVTGLRDDAVALFARDTAPGAGYGALTWMALYRHGVGGVTGLDGAAGVALSPDGEHLYVTGSLSHAVALFRRNTTPGPDLGKLTFVESIADGPSTDGLAGARHVVVSQDGGHVYVAGFGDHSVVMMSRHRDPADATQFGRLTYLGRVEDGPSSDGLAGASGLALSPDGRHLYVAGESDHAVAVLARDAATGELTWASVRKDGVPGPGGTPGSLGGASAVAVSPDGLHVYVVAAVDGAVTAFSRDSASGALTLVDTRTGLAEARGVVVSPDGELVFVAARSGGLVAPFERFANGALQPLAPLTLAGATSVTLAPHGTHLYATSFTGNSLSLIRESFGASCGVPAESSGDIDREIDLPVGATVTFSVHATVQAGASGDLVNTAVVAVPSPLVTDLDDTNDSSTDVNELRKEADLQVTKSAGSGTAVPGRTLSYLLQVSNQGPSSVDPVRVRDLDLAGADITAATWSCLPTGGAVCPASAGSGPIDQLVNMPAGSAVSYQINVSLAPTAIGVACNPPQGGSCVRNTASAELPEGGGYTDPTPGNATAVVETPLLPEADLRITKTAIGSPAPGDPLQFVITVENCGPSFAAGAMVTDNFPADYAVTGWSCAVDQGAGTACPPGGPFSGDIGHAVDLAAGTEPGCGSPGRVVFTVEGTVDLNAEGVLSNIAQVTHAADPTTGNNRSTARVFLTAEADVMLVKDDGRAEAIPGESVTYSITVSNLGPDPVQEALVEDYFPAILRDISWTCSSESPALGVLSFAEEHFVAAGAIRGVALSPDGRHLYATRSGNNALWVFARHLDTGLLEPIQQLVDGQAGASGLQGAFGVLVSPDGLNVYVTAPSENALSVFRRDANSLSPDFGKLTEVQVARNGQNVGGAVVAGLEGPLGMVASPGGAHLYVAGFNGNAVLLFERDATDQGLLAFKQVVRETDSGISGLVGPTALAVDPRPEGSSSGGGEHVYLASHLSSSVVVFQRHAATGVLTLLEVWQDADAAPAIPGAQLAGAVGEPALLGAGSVVVAPGGQHVYVASPDEDAVAVFARGADGRLSYLGSRFDSDDGTGGAAVGLQEASAVVPSSDGQHLYVTGRTSNAVTVFQRNQATGALKFLDSYSDGVAMSCATGGDPCTPNRLAGAMALAISPNGQNVYVGSDTDSSVSVFRRAGVPPAFAFIGGTPGAEPPVPVRNGDLHGGLTVEGLGGAAAVAVAGDGAHVYAVGYADDAVAVFERDSASGQLTFVQRVKNGIDGVTGLEGAIALAVEGTSVYVVSQSVEDTKNTVVVFARNPATGHLSFLEEHRETLGGSLGIMGASAVVVSPLGEHVYVAGRYSNAVAIFTRNPADGTLTWKAAVRASTVPGLRGAAALAFAADGEHLYVAGSEDHALVVLHRFTGIGASFGLLTPRQVFQDENKVPAIAGAVRVPGLARPLGVAVAPDLDASGSRNVYVASHVGDAVAVFRREVDNSSSGFGQLTFLERHRDGQSGVDGLNGARAVRVSPDGKHVYVAGEDDDALAVFAREGAAGRLVFVEARRDGVEGVAGLDQAYAVAVAPGGRHIYVVGFGSHALAAFSRESGSRCTGSGTGDIVDLVDLAPGGQVVYTAVATVDPAATGTLTNQATVTPPDSVTEPVDAIHEPGTCPDNPPGSDNNVCVDVDVLAPRADLQVTKTDEVETVVPGSEHTYTIIVRNEGPSNVVGATVVDDLTAIFPAGASWTCLAAPSGSLGFLERARNGEPIGTPPEVVAGLDGVAAVAVSSDGLHLYTASIADDALVVFRIGSGTGRLSFVELHQDGVDGADGLDGASAVALSPDGEHLYATSQVDDALLVFRRDAATGALTHLQTLQDTGAPSIIPGATLVTGLDQAVAVALDPDPDGEGEAAGGDNVYVAAANSNAITVFRRNVDPLSADFGRLTFVERLRDGIEVPDGLAGARDVTVAPDGAHVYAVGANDNAVVAFSRDPATGSLAFLEVKANDAQIRGLAGARSVVVSADGASLYVAGPDDNGLAHFRRDPGTGTLTFLAFHQNGVAGFDGLAGATGLHASADGFHLYVASAGASAVAVLRRNPADDGRLTFAQAVRDGSGAIDGLDAATALVLRPDGRYLYVAGRVDDAVAVFARPVDSRCASGAATPAIAGDPVVLEDEVDIAAGTEIVYQVTGVIAADACPPPYPCSAARLENTASVELPASVVDPVPGNNQDTDSNRLSPRVDLEITKHDDFVVVEGLAGASAVAVSPGGGSVYATGLVGDGVAIFGRDAGTGELTYRGSRLDGVDGVDGLNGASAVVVSPDGAHVYVAGSADHAVAAFVRAPADGDLTFLERQAHGVAGVTGLLGASALAISADGRHLYVAASLSHAVVLLRRDADPASESYGRLTFGGLLQDGVGGVDGLAGARALTLGGGGAHLYVAGQADDAVAVLRRSASTGELSLVQVVRNGIGGVLGLSGPLGIAASPDGEHVYAAAAGSSSVAAFDRDADIEVLCTPALVASGVCTPAQLGLMVANPSFGKLTFVAAYVEGAGGIQGVAGASALALRPDTDGPGPDPGGQYLYVAGFAGDSIAVFARDAGSGGLELQGFVAEGSGGVVGLSGVRALAIAPDAGHLYAAAQSSHAVTAFVREPGGLLGYLESHVEGGGGVAPGTEVVYRIEVTNHGPSSVVGARVTDIFPAALTAVAWTCVPLTPGAACLPFGSGDIVAQSVTLPAGGRVRFTATGTVKADAVGAVTNTATVAAPSGVIELDPSNNSATDADTVLAPRADLTIEKIACSDPQECAATMVTSAVPGAAVHYRITVANEGPSDARGAVVTDLFPGPLSDVAWTCEALPVPGLLTGAQTVRDGDPLDTLLPGTCGDPIQAFVDGLAGATALAVAPDGLSLYAAGFVDNAVVAFRRDLRNGRLEYAGFVRDGDVLRSPEPACTVLGSVDGLAGARALAMSADGKHLYVAGQNDDAVAVFGRDALTSRLTFLGFVRDGVGANGLGGVVGLGLSPNGGHLYTAAPGDNGIGIFSRDSGSGLLSYLGLVADGQSQGGLVVDGLAGAAAVLVSADGKHVYAAGPLDHGVAAFRRDNGTGALQFLAAVKDGQGPVDGLAGVSALALSPEGTHLYAAGTGEAALAAFARDSTAQVTCTSSMVSAGLCSSGQLGQLVANPDYGKLSFLGAVHNGVGGVEGLSGVRSVQVAPDGRHVYAAGAAEDAVAIFRRDPGTGALAFLGALTDGGPVDGLAGARAVLVSDDGGQVYVAGADDHAVAVLDRELGSSCSSHGFGHILDGLDLRAGGSATYDVTARLASSATGMLTNLATVAPGAGTPDPDLDNNSATLVLELTPEGALRVTKDDGQEEAVPGLPLSYVITVENEGPSDLPGVAVEDLFPAAFLGAEWSCSGSEPLEPIGLDVDGDGGLTVLDGVRALVVAPDPDGLAGPSAGGRHLYAAASDSDALAIFSRDTAPVVECTTEMVGAGQCAPDQLGEWVTNPQFGALSFVAAVRDSDPGVDGLAAVRGLAVAPDGRHLYAASPGDHALSAFARDAESGLLSFAQVLREADPALDGLEGASAVAVAPDGRTVYATGELDDAVAVFRRDPGSGLLTFVHRLKEGFGDVPMEALDGPVALTVSPDGRHVVVASAQSHSLAVFSHDPVTGRLTYRQVLRDDVAGVDGLRLVQGVTMSPDGRDVYAVSLADDAVSLFRRDPGTGLLTFVRAYRDGEDGIDGLDGARGVAVTRDGQYLYATGFNDDAVVAFRRDGTSGELGFVRSFRSSAGIDGLGGARALALSPDDAHLYTGGQVDDSIVTFRRQGQGVCGAGGTGDLLDVVDLEAGGRVEYVVDGLVDPGATGTLENTVTVTAADGTTNTGDGSATDIDVLTPVAALTLTKDDGVDEVVAGNSVTYLVTVVNAGPSHAPGSVVDDPMPAEIASANWSCEGVGGGTCSAAGTGSLVGEIANLPAGGSVTYTIVATVDPAATGTLVNVATVAPASGVSDPDLSDNQASDETVILQMADLAIVKTVAQEPVAPGAPVEFTLEVANLGPSVASDIEVVDLLPTGALPLAAVGAGWDCSLDEVAGTASCSRATLEPGAAPAITVTASAPPDSGLYVNAAVVSAATADPEGANDSSSASFGVIAEAPVVLWVGTLPDTGDGELTEMETATVAITELALAFSSPMHDPPGDDEPDDVTNPESYLLLAAGADGVFATEGCGALLGDDLEVPVAGVTYDPESDIAYLALAVDEGLEDGLYRLLACGAALRDVVGNPLDGNGDGVGGDDFSRHFRVRVHNLLVEPHFDFADSLDSWVLVQDLPGEISHDATDADGFELSGSARMDNLSSATLLSLSQCVELTASRVYELCGRARLDAAPGVPVAVVGRADFSSDLTCGLPPVGGAEGVRQSGDSDGEFVELRGLVTAPASALSAWVTFFAEAPGADAFAAFLDSLCFQPATGLFSDGFESGTTEEWSQTLP